MVFISCFPWLSWAEYKTWAGEHVCPQRHALIQARNPRTDELLRHIFVPRVDEFPNWMEVIFALRVGFGVSAMDS